MYDMKYSSSSKNVEQILEKLFSKQLQENYDRCFLLEKKIGVNVMMSKKIVKKILESKLIESDNNDENNGNFLCAHFHDVVFQDISAVGVLNVNKIDTCHATIKPSILSSFNENKSELVRLASAKRLSEALTLKLESEEARLKAEVDFLTKFLEDSSVDNDEFSVLEQDADSLVNECNQLTKNCLESVKYISWSDHLESNRAKFKRRKARQTAYLNIQDRKIQEAQLTCCKLEIFRDIMTLEDNALCEMFHCVEKIHTALKKYFEICLDIKSRFQISATMTPNGLDPNVFDADLGNLLTDLLLESPDESLSPENFPNEILLKKLEEKIALLEAKNAASLSAMKEFGQVANEISLLLGKALQWLECSDGNEGHQQQPTERAESLCIYWNALSSFSVVIPNRLVERILQVRKELDNATASLRKIELAFDLNSEL